MPKTRVTLKDVALESGVSPSTVSFVLNKAPNQTIPQATQDRVRAAAKALGYRPNWVAKALREGSSRIILLNTGTYSGSRSMASLILGIDQELQSHGYSLLVTHYARQADIPELLLESVSAHTVVDLTQFDFPEPEIDLGGAWGEGMTFHATTQMQHLVDRGHTHIACIVPAGSDDNRYVQLRTRNFRSVAQQMQLPEPHFVQVEMNREHTKNQLITLKQQHPQITALACYSDEYALLALSAMSDLGFAAPDDLAVIGFDESSYAGFWSPRLTTVRINSETIGRRVARSVLGLDLTEPDGHPSETIVGETT